MAAVRVAQAPRTFVEFREKESGIGAVCGVLVEKPVHRAQQEARLFAGQGKLAAQVGLEICHQECGRYAFAGDVANQQTKPLLSQSKKVIVVAADMASLDTNAGVVEVLEGREAFAGRAWPALVWQFPSPGRRGAPIPVSRRWPAAGPRFHGSSHQNRAVQRSFRRHLRKRQRLRRKVTSAADEESGPRGSSRARTSH